MRTVEPGSAVRSIVRPVANTLKPDSDRLVAIPLPTPRDAPVTSAVLIASFIDSILGISKFYLSFDGTSPAHQIPVEPPFIVCDRSGRSDQLWRPFPRASGRAASAVS